MTGKKIPEHYLTSGQACELCNINRSTLMDWKNKRVINFTKVGRKYFYDGKDLLNHSVEMDLIHGDRYSRRAGKYDNASATLKSEIAQGDLNETRLSIDQRELLDKQIVKEFIKSIILSTKQSIKGLANEVAATMLGQPLEENAILIHKRLGIMKSIVLEKLEFSEFMNEYEDVQEALSPYGKGRK